jgi:adenosine deaminase
VNELGPRELRELPKVELHRHLDGSVRVQTIIDLVRHHNLDVGTRNPDEIARRARVLSPMKDLSSVLASFGMLQKVLCSYEAIRRVTYENVEDAWLDGVHLVELRFAPTFIAYEKEIGHDEIIEGVLDGASQGMDAYPIQVGLIGIAARSAGVEPSRAGLRELIRYRRSLHRSGDRIYGFDLADAEDTTDPAAFAPLVAEARAAGMGITVHSGESTSAEHLVRALRLYAPDRIGHGIKAWGDEEAIALLRERGTMLEVCPTSNWLTSSVPSLEEHPIRKLREARVRVCINSDDPNLMGIDLVNEYAVCARLHGFDHEAFASCNRDALAASFVDAEAKQYAERRLGPKQ